MNKSRQGSIGSKLFLYVLGGALVGLGGMSYFFYQALERKATEEIQVNLSTQITTIEGKLARAEQSMINLAAVATTLREMGITKAESYEQVIFDLFQQRPPLTMALNFGQAPGQMVPDKSAYWPYFFVDQEVPGQVGETLPPPHNDVRFADVCVVDPDCFQQDYYKLPVEAGKTIWLEPYIWTGVTMTTVTAPFYDENSTLIGVSGLDINVTELGERVQAPASWEDGYFAIISEQGNLIVYPPEPEKAENLANYQDVAILTKIWPRIGTEHNGLFVAEGKYWAYERVNGTNWLMLAVVPQSVVLGPVLSITVGSALGAGMVLALVVTLFVRQLNHRLASILQECKKLTSADKADILQWNPNPELLANTQQSDELGVVARSFEQMARQLQASLGTLEAQNVDLQQAQAQLSAYNETLEQEVEQRTAALAASMSRVQDTLAYVKTIIDNMADGLLATDAEGQIAQINPAFMDMFGVSKREGSSQSYRLDEFPPTLIELVEQARKNPDQMVAGEVDLSEGGVGKAIATPILKKTENQEEENQYLGSVILVRDITADREVDQMKTDFISTVSHELRTPLTSVLGFAKIIRKKLDEGIFPILPEADKKIQRTARQISENIAIIVSEGERLTALINDVLDIAKMEAGRVDWKMQPIQVEELIERAIAATSSLFDQKQLELRREIEPELPIVEGDADRLLQVVINLISNAVKFTDQGAITCRARLTLEGITVGIVDSGIGIAPEDQPKVFEKFKQVGDTLTDKPKGTGLGLPICKQIVEHHGGTIWVESQLGQGSTFFFTLPLKEASAADSSRLEVVVPPIPESLDTQSLIQWLREDAMIAHAIQGDERKAVLVVDDDTNIRALLRQSLEAEGYLVWEARDGVEAIAQLKEHCPHLIILDVMMPHLNGFDVASVVRNDPQTMNIPIIIVSIVEDQERGYRLGIDQYFTKPINTEALLQAVGHLVTQSSFPRTALICDEELLTIETLSKLLSHRGFKVIQASNYRELLDKAIAVKPDMIIANARYLDQHDGVRTLKCVKGLEQVRFFLLGDHQEPPVSR